jgi:hypothetical protein
MQRLDLCCSPSRLSLVICPFALVSPVLTGISRAQVVTTALLLTLLALVNNRNLMACVRGALSSLPVALLVTALYYAATMGRSFSLSLPGLMVSLRRCVAKVRDSDPSHNCQVISVALLSSLGPGKWFDGDVLARPAVFAYLLRTSGILVLGGLLLFRVL